VNIARFPRPLPRAAPLATKLNNRPPNGDDVIMAVQFARRQGRAVRMPDEPERGRQDQHWSMPSEGDGVRRTAYLIDGRVYMNEVDVIIFGPNGPETLRDDWFDCGAMPINK
jgi:hypothetical protein